MFLTAEQRKKLMSALAGGLFVTCGKEKPNIMTTHWGALGAFWHKQVFVLPVRAGKRSHEILAETGSFAVSVPTTDMRNEIMLCDTMSGYAVNKFEALHLHPKRARKIPAYVLGECGLILECKVVYTATAEDGSADDALKADMYNGKQYHTMFFGEIIDCYEHK
ncbi:MAG: flavin reductase family protein [Clostridia bacterium]|jgi:flavin reductase (DIM6/NTAB) family NADH-FMN oxidoreductase RutF|nr:flavin reductase family protein [Clostridia bacterium]